jgi:hypothetical protein
VQAVGNFVDSCSDQCLGTLIVIAQFADTDTALEKKILRSGVTEHMMRTILPGAYTVFCTQI